MFGLRRDRSHGDSDDDVMFGGQSMVHPLKQVVMRKPAPSISPANEAATFHYPNPPDDDAANREHAAFVDLLTEHGVEVLVAEPGPEGLHDAIFVYDTSFMTDDGVILLHPGKEVRRPEVELAAALWAELGVPILGEIEAPGTVEGGDIFWIDANTVAIGEGYRTNAAGIDQLEVFLRSVGVDLVRTQLPYWTGPADCLHLLSLLSPVAEKTAVAHVKLMAAAFVEELRARGWSFIDIPESEFATQATNVLALAPGKVVMLKDNPITIQLLRDAGIKVLTYVGDEISHNRAGGPTCLTNPMFRDRFVPEPEETETS